MSQINLFLALLLSIKNTTTCRLTEQVVVVEKLYTDMKHYETYSARMASAYLIGAQYFATGKQQLNVSTISPICI